MRVIFNSPTFLFRLFGFSFLALAGMQFFILYGEGREDGLAPLEAITAVVYSGWSLLLVSGAIALTISLFWRPVGVDIEKKVIVDDQNAQRSDDP